MATEPDKYPYKTNEEGRHPDIKYYFKCVFGELSKQREENRFCDITVVVGGQRFPAHKGILVFVSDYFKTMFNSGFKEATASEVTIDGNSEAFERVLDFAYSGELHVTPELIFEVTQMVCYLQCEHALETCVVAFQRLVKRKEDQLDVEILYQTYLLAQRHGEKLLPMVPICINVLASKFEKFSQTEMFVTDVSVEFLEQFLNRNDLTAFCPQMTEEKVLKAATGWLNYNWEDRKEHAERLLKKVRLGAIPRGQLKTYISDEMENEPGCKALLKRFLNSPSALGDVASSSSGDAMFSPRGVQVLLRVNPGTTSHLIQYFNPNTSKWVKCFPNITGKAGTSSYTLPGGIKERIIDSLVSVHSIDGQLYVGLRTEKTFKNFVTYNRSSGWTQLPKPTASFTGGTVAYLNRCLYVVGAYSTKAKVDKIVYGCEVKGFNLDTKIWEDLPPIPSSQEVTSVAPFMGKLFVYAVVNSKSSLFVFDPVLKKWKCCKLKMSKLVFDARLEIEDGKLYRVLLNRVSHFGLEPIVTELVVYKSDLLITLGTQQDQSSRLPVYKFGKELGTFVIGDSLFANLNGYMHKLRIRKDKWGSSDVRRRIESLMCDVRHTPVFCKYIFDKVNLSMGLPST